MNATNDGSIGKRNLRAFYAFLTAWALLSVAAIWWLRKGLLFLEVTRLLPIEYGVVTCTSVIGGLVIYQEHRCTCDAAGLHSQTTVPLGPRGTRAFRGSGAVWIRPCDSTELRLEQWNGERCK